MGDFKLEIVGGLGNQLFGVAAGLYLEAKSGLKVEFVSPYFGRGNTTHNETLNGETIFGREIGVRKMRAHQGLQVSIANALKTNFPRAKYSGAVEIDPTRVRPGQILRGYFQVCEPWKHLQSRGLLHVPLSWDSQDCTSYSGGMSAFMHIRFGDYEVLPEFSMERERYYPRAVERLKEVRPDITRVLVFSDNVSAAENLISKFVPQSTRLQFSYVPSSTGAKQSLAMMSKMTAGILANSTFSYWGAVLGIQNKTVFTPDPWFRNQPKRAPELPPNWERVEQ